MKQGQHSTAKRRPRVLTVVAFVMILFGAVEVVTAFTHSFVGISTSPRPPNRFLARTR